MSVQTEIDDLPRSEKTTLIVRMTASEKELFAELCKRLDTTMSREIRLYIKKALHDAGY